MFFLACQSSGSISKHHRLQQFAVQTKQIRQCTGAQCDCMTNLAIIVSKEQQLERIFQLQLYRSLIDEASAPADSDIT